MDTSTEYQPVWGNKIDDLELICNTQTEHQNLDNKNSVNDIILPVKIVKTDMKEVQIEDRQVLDMNINDGTIMIEQPLTTGNSNTSLATNNIWNDVFEEVQQDNGQMLDTNITDDIMPIELTVATGDNYDGLETNNDEINELKTQTPQKRKKHNDLMNLQGQNYFEKGTIEFETPKKPSRKRTVRRKTLMVNDENCETDELEETKTNLNNMIVPVDDQVDSSEEWLPTDPILQDECEISTDGDDNWSDLNGDSDDENDNFNDKDLSGYEFQQKDEEVQSARVNDILVNDRPGLIDYDSEGELDIKTFKYYKKYGAQVDEYYEPTDDYDFSSNRISLKTVRYKDRNNLDGTMKVSEKKENKLFSSLFTEYLVKIQIVETVDKNRSTVKKTIGHIIHYPDAYLNWLASNETDTDSFNMMRFLEIDETTFMAISSPLKWMETIAGESGNENPIREGFVYLVLKINT